MKLISMELVDVRYPTSALGIGSDAVHKDPDYSAAYVVLRTDSGLSGHGLTFTVGAGNQLCLEAARAYWPQLKGKDLGEITADFGAFWRSLANHHQLRWLGPEKGVIHLALAAVVNALWDLWAKVEGKPLWRLLAEMEPADLVRCIDFRNIEDALSKAEALAILEKAQAGRAGRQAQLLAQGYPAYTTSVGWMGYPDEKIVRLAQEGLAQGWTAFKLKVGGDLKADLHRAGLVRQQIGPDKVLMLDANQNWGVDEAISSTKAFLALDPFWMEEPTSPDDILGHKAIREAIRPIKVATGEHCQNRVLWKQLLFGGAVDYCQLDACRLGGVNEALAVILMAAKAGIPVCPHAGGIGLCELMQHLPMFDFVAVSGSWDGKYCEYVGHLHEHFVQPVQVEQGRYLAPAGAGTGLEMKPESLAQFPWASVT